MTTIDKLNDFTFTKAGTDADYHLMLDQAGLTCYTDLVAMCKS